ncbi:MAG: signal recognition particle protein [Bacteroidia bacterium]|nr:signal recognition particle protein [Bacteroidia bacterium]
MFENLSEKIEKSFRILKGEGRITEVNIAETLKEVRRALLDADVNFKIAKAFTDQVKQKALGMDVLKSIKPDQMLVKIVYDELIQLMGGQYQDVNIHANPAIILLAGLQGSGKTTFAAKIAAMLKSKRGKRLGEQIEIPVYTEEGNSNPVEIVKAGIKYAKEYSYTLVVIDTAGRLAIDEQMMNEISAIKQAVNPHEILFIVDAMTGQDAVNTAKAFNERLDFNGVVLTKFDGDTRGGAALSIKAEVNKPIKFVSTGEKLDAIDVFHPERMADRIIGMGDVRSLVEKVQEQYDVEEARKLQKKIAKNQFDFNDFLSQIKQIKKMGNLKDLAGMIPGMGKAMKNVEIDDNAFKNIEAIINSMTHEERTHPEVLNGNRRKRIAMGSGTTIQEVNQLINQFDETRKMMKMFTGNKAQQLSRMMSRMPRR